MLKLLSALWLRFCQWCKPQPIREVEWTGLVEALMPMLSDYFVDLVEKSRICVAGNEVLLISPYRTDFFDQQSQCDLPMLCIRLNQAAAVQNLKLESITVIEPEQRITLWLDSRGLNAKVQRRANHAN